MLMETTVPLDVTMLGARRELSGRVEEEEREM
jgi:hypothetical protein